MCVVCPRVGCSPADCGALHHHEQSILKALMQARVRRHTCCPYIHLLHLHLSHEEDQGRRGSLQLGQHNEVIVIYSSGNSIVFFCFVLIGLIPFCWIKQSESQDQVFLRWTTGETATMHILVVHAMVILLTLGPPKGMPNLCVSFPSEN